MSIKLKHIVISEKNQISALYSDDILKELKTYNSKYHIGDIYLGKLESGLSNINAAFIKLHSNEKNGFIQLANLIPITVKKNTLIRLENLKFNESILVQITKEPTGTKGPSLSTNIGLTGKYLILLPFAEGISISKKISNFTEKHYLRAFISLLKPLNLGVLIKKEACGIKELILKEDFLLLLKTWYQIQAKIQRSLDPSLVSGKIDFIEDTMKAFYDTKVIKISIDSILGSWKVYKKLILTKQKEENIHVTITHYSNSTYFLKYLNLDFSIYSLLQSTLNLRTGGSIVIEKTEALTAIDVNSGSFNHLKSSRATLLWINCEAATEISKQLKLRNIGGIIVIDFIDMHHQKDQMKLLNHFNSVLQTDKRYTKIIQLSDIGLIELTRKRQGQNIYDVFSHICSKCNGLGHQVIFPSIKTLNKNLKLSENYQTYMHDLIGKESKVFKMDLSM